MSKIIDKIYLDMDGVLADFDGHFFNLYGESAREFETKHGQTAFWETIYENPTFFKDLPVMPNFGEIVEVCSEIASKVIILSSPSRTNTPICVLHKREWLDKHLHSQFPAIFTSKKEKYSGIGRILIDDTKDKCDKWTKSGGVSHHYQGINGFNQFVDALVQELS